MEVCYSSNMPVCEHVSEHGGYHMIVLAWRCVIIVIACTFMELLIQVSECGGLL